MEHSRKRSVTYCAMLAGLSAWTYLFFILITTDQYLNATEVKPAILKSLTCYLDRDTYLCTLYFDFKNSDELHIVNWDASKIKKRFGTVLFCKSPDGTLAECKAFPMVAMAILYTGFVLVFIYLSVKLNW